MILGKVIEAGNMWLFNRIDYGRSWGRKHFAVDMRYETRI